VFTPTEVDYNPLRLQAQPYVVLLQDPRSINNVIKFSIKPPRIKAYTRVDEVWNPWRRTTVLVQSTDLVPLPNMSDNDTGDTSGYLRMALHQAKKTTKAFLSSIRELTTSHTQSNTNPKRAPDGSYILSHPKKESSS
jgi:hypothetical protein